MQKILDQFQNISFWKFLQLIKNNGLELKELNNNKWKPLTTVKGNFEEYHKPIFLYEKTNGKMKITAVGLYKSL